MDFKNLDTKSIIEKEKYFIVDFTEQKVDLRNHDPKIMAVNITPDRFNMRIDNIVFSHYSNLSNVDIVLKYNEISNPFSINSGDLIMFIDNLSAAKIIKTESKIEEIRKLIRDQFVDKNKMPIQSKAFNEYKKTHLPPQYKSDNKSNIQVKNNVLVFGGQNNQNSTLTPSRENFLKSLNK